MASKGQAPPRVYWDSCVFISYIEQQATRYPDIDALFDEARKGDIEILTSVATITEVAYTESERLSRALDPAEETKIKKLWTPPSPVKLVEFHRLIAEDARDLLRLSLASRWGLRPYDALHLSTARYMRVARFETYDKGLPKYAATVGCAVGEPRAGQLPMWHSAPT
jgi:predicted nucleic acid-binding protein